MNRTASFVPRWTVFSVNRYPSMYKTDSLSKSRVCISSTNNNSIKVLWCLCTCSVYVHTIVPVSNHHLEKCMRSCGDTNSTIKCDGWTHRWTDRHTNVWRRIKLYALFHFMAVAGGHIKENIKIRLWYIMMLWVLIRSISNEYPQCFLWYIFWPKFCFKILCSCNLKYFVEWQTV